MWEIKTYYKNKVDKTYTFKTEQEAIDKFNLLSNGFRYGLVGHSVSYPKQLSNVHLKQQEQLESSS